MKSLVIDDCVASWSDSGESTRHGAIPLTRTPRSIHSTAKARVSWTTAPLLVDVRTRVREGREAADRGEVDDAAAALREHVATERLARKVRALDVEVEDRVEALLREVLGRAAERRARAVDEDVDLPELADDAVRQSPRPPARSVTSQWSCAPGRPGRAIVAAVAAAPSSSMSIDDDASTGLGEALGDRGSDPAAAARDTGDATTEAEEALDESGRDLEVGSARATGWFTGRSCSILRCRAVRRARRSSSAAF